MNSMYHKMGYITCFICGKKARTIDKFKKASLYGDHENCQSFAQHVRMAYKKSQELSVPVTIELLLKILKR